MNIRSIFVALLLACAVAAPAQADIAASYAAGSTGCSVPGYSFLGDTASGLTSIGVGTAALCINNVALIQYGGAKMAAASGTQVAVDVEPNVNQSGTAGYTGYLINVTETATGSGTKRLLDIQKGGTTQLNLDNSGNLNLATNAGVFRLGASNDVILSRAAAAKLQFGAADVAAPVAQQIGVQNVVAGTTDTAGANFSIAGSIGTGAGVGGNILGKLAYAGSTGTAQNSLSTVLTLNGTNNAASGTTVLVDVSPTINGSGTNGFIGLRVNVTETAQGSTAGELLALAVGGTQRFGVTDGLAAVGTRIRTAQATAPTCTTNCGSSPTVVGTDSAGVITIGGTPSNAFVLAFNGTWEAAPACTVTQQTTAANYVTKALSGTTSLTISTAAGPTASDKLSYVCLGVQ